MESGRHGKDEKSTVNEWQGQASCLPLNLGKWVVSDGFFH